MIRWLLGPTIASLVASFLVIRLFDILFSGVTGTVANVARPVLFTGTWSATTAASGMRGVNERVRKLRTIVGTVKEIGNDQ